MVHYDTECVLRGCTLVYIPRRIPPTLWMSGYLCWGHGGSGSIQGLEHPKDQTIGGSDPVYGYIH